MINPVKFISKFFKSNNQKELDRIHKIVEKVNKWEEEISKLKGEDFPVRTKEFKERIKKGDSLDTILPEAFALVREASKRTRGERHFDAIFKTWKVHFGTVKSIMTFAFLKAFSSFNSGLIPEIFLFIFLFSVRVTSLNFLSNFDDLIIC